MTFKTDKAFGWVISIMIHGCIAAGLLIVGIQASRQVEEERERPRTTIERPAREMVEVRHVELETATRRPQLRMEPALTYLAKMSSDNMPSERILSVSSDAAGDFTAAGETGPAGSVFCGSRGKGQRVCFVVDCSGSMVIAFEYVRHELGRSLGELEPDQYFNVVFFAGRQPVRQFSGRLERAHAGNRRRARAYIGQSDIQLLPVMDEAEATAGVIKGMEKALAVRTSRHEAADLIFLLTDGQFDQARFRAAMRARQSERGSPAVINTVACGVRKNETFLRDFAESYKGTYTFVSDETMAEWRKIKSDE